jgi:hypothetical protein
MNNRSHYKAPKHGHANSGLPRESENGFQCKVCHAYVSTAFAQSGVQNRNHCPYCLSSRHLDWLNPGDRLSACKEPMKALALTVKATHNKYGPSQGELMLVHRCTGCGKFSINRIAADDDVDEICAIYEASVSLEAELKEILADQGIYVLETGDRSLVRAQLFGR